MMMMIYVLFVGLLTVEWRKGGGLRTTSSCPRFPSVVQTSDGTICNAEESCVGTGMQSNCSQDIVDGDRRSHRT